MDRKRNLRIWESHNRCSLGYVNHTINQDAIPTEKPFYKPHPTFRYSHRLESFKVFKKIDLLPICCQIGNKKTAIALFKDYYGFC